MREAKVKLPTSKGGKKDYMLWEIKFLAYAHVCEFDAVLEKDVNLTKKEKDVSDQSVLYPNNTGDMAKNEMKQKNGMAIAYITSFKMNMAMNNVNKSKSSDWPNELS